MRDPFHLKSRTLRNITDWLFTPIIAMKLYTLMRMGMHFMIAISFAKIGLSTSQIGNYEWMIWIGSLTTSFWVDALMMTFYREISLLPFERQKPFARLSFVLFTSVGLAIMIFFSAAKGYMVPALTGQSDLVGFNSYLVYLAFQVGTYPTEAWFVLQKDGKTIIFWGIASFMLHLLALVFFTWVTGQMVAGLQAVALLALFRWLYSGLLAFKDGLQISTLAEMRSWLHMASIVMVQSGIAYVIISFDAWLLGYLKTDNQTFALFRYASREFPLALAAATSVTVNMLPMLTEGWERGTLEEGLEAMKEKLRKFLPLVFAVGIIVIMSAEWLFKHVFNPDFVQAVPLFVVYMLLTTTRVLLPNVVFLAKGEGQPMVWVSTGELVLKVVTGWYFYHWFGLIGIAWSFVLSALFEKCALIIYLWRRHGVMPNQYIPLKLYFVFTFLMLAAVAWKFTQL